MVSDLHLDHQKVLFRGYFIFSLNSHWNPYCNPNFLPSPEIIGLERKQKEFWNQTTTENKLGTCRMLGADLDENKYPPSIMVIMFEWSILLYNCVTYCNQLGFPLQLIHYHHPYFLVWNRAFLLSHVLCCNQGHRPSGLGPSAVWWLARSSSVVQLIIILVNDT